jgi:hypothetical protein
MASSGRPVSSETATARLRGDDRVRLFGIFDGDGPHLILDDLLRSRS